MSTNKIRRRNKEFKMTQPTSIQRDTLSILRVEYVSFRYIFRPAAWLAMDGRTAALSEAAPT